MNMRVILVLLIGGGALVLALRPGERQPPSAPPVVKASGGSKPVPAWFKRHQDLYGRIDHTLVKRSNP